MTKKLCFMTRLLAAVLAVVMLSSAIYIAVEANHDCSGEDCAICHQIGVCENLLKSLGLAGAAAAITAAFTYTMCKAILPSMEFSDMDVLLELWQTATPKQIAMMSSMIRSALEASKD